MANSNMHIIVDRVSLIKRFESAMTLFFFAENTTPIMGRRLIFMITFSILVLTLLLLIAFVVFSVSVLGATGIVVFGDVIVCIVFIVMLIKFIIKRRKR